MSESVRFALLDRLHDEGILPEECDAEIGRTYAGSVQRVQGAWSWMVMWGPPGGLLTRSAGSQYTMTECLRAPRWVTFEHHHGDINIDPDPIPKRRK
jgi:hypothetical protein